ncbi:MAG: HD domain-containing phosphohydrolase [Candidatus Omnitrophota bacterium]
MMQKEKTSPLHLAGLYQISKIIGSTYNLTKLLDLIIDLMMQETKSESGSIMLFDDEAKVLKIAAARGLNEKIIKTVRLRPGEAIAGRVAKEQKPLLIDHTTIKNFKKTSRRGLKSALSLPMISYEKLVGVINVNRKAKSINFNQQDLKQFHAFASQMAVAVQNAIVYIQAEEKMQNLFKFTVINRALNYAFDTAQITNILTESIKELFIYDLYALFLNNNPEHLLYIQSQKPVSSNIIQFIKSNIANTLASLTHQPAQHYIKNTRLKLDAPEKSRPGKLTRQLKSSIFSPIISNDKLIGIISLGRLNYENFTCKDQHTLFTLARELAIALQNANIHHRLHNTYVSTVRALTAAVEAKNPYSRGHSERVTQYAIMIAQAMKLPKNLIEVIHIAGILHDIGKIGIPEPILSKPGKLSKEEFSVIYTHPGIGKRILEQVNFFFSTAGAFYPRQQKSRKKPTLIKKTHSEVSVEILDSAAISEEIKTIILHHHERYVGGGYPAGLKGKKIPLGSRIIAVADAYEAMTANRPYRHAFTRAEALIRLKKNSGTQFDPEIVKIFTALNIGGDNHDKNGRCIS